MPKCRDNRRARLKRRRKHEARLASRIVWWDISWLYGSGFAPGELRYDGRTVKQDDNCSTFSVAYQFTANSLPCLVKVGPLTAVAHGII